MNYNYQEAKNRVFNILHSKTKIETARTIPNSESEFTYENGIRSWVGALFIDIRNSTNYFKKNKDEIVARVMRAFCSEIITILRQNDKYRQIGIRGDCVYAIYSAPMQDDLKSILEDAIFVNTFQEMFQCILRNNQLPQFSIGIGLGANKDLVIKAGKKNTEISDYIWIGDAVVNASKLSSLGNKEGFQTIVLDRCFHDNIKDKSANNKDNYSQLFKDKYSYELKENVYHGDIINTSYNNWIKKEFGCE